MEYADDLLSHDGYNITDTCDLRIAPGCYGAYFYYNLSEGGVYDGTGSTIYMPFGVTGTALWWGSYIKIGTNSYSIQWQSDINDYGNGGAVYITPWHYDPSLIVIKNEDDITQDYSISLKQGEFVA
jgi:hypothetical protein